MSITTERPVTSFQDWHQISRTDHNLNNAEVLQSFGNDVSKPDTNNATYFVYNDDDLDDKPFQGTQPARSYHEHYRRLALYHDGSWNGSRWSHSIYQTRRQKLHMLEAISGQMDLHPSRFRKAKSILMSLNLGEVGCRIEYSIFALCAYVIHSDQGCGRRVHPNTPPDRMDPKLSALLTGMEASIRLTLTEFRRTYGRIESELRSRKSSSQLPQHTERRTDGYPIKYDRFDMDSRRVLEHPTQDQRDAAVQAKW